MTQLVIPGDDSAGEPPNVDETVTLGSYASGGSRYRILRPIGRGGVGEVWLARDVELNRDVALKQLLAKHRDKDDFRRRFLREVKATAALEHPGIIPVYDIGQHPDGTLFQVMRYFGEENFHSLIRDYHRDHPSTVDDAAFRGLLGHFIAACRAIAYVHARDVVHLDLKPANVVTGEFGETQVIDWGMAWIRGQALWERVAEESGALSGGASGGDSGQSGGASDAVKPGGSRPVPDMTRPVGFRGTPAYAAPEQHRGRWDAIGPRTDVYGLGATLFFLLADKAPFAVQSDSFHTDVLAGHLQAEPKPWVPRALVAIARKAMAVDPANRYASAAELADDVDRFLADEPVTAFPDPWQTRLWRQVKRHRTAVSTAAALLLTSAVALGIGYVAVSEQRDIARKAEKEAVDQRERAVEAERVAVEERDRAKDAEAEAHRQAELARDNAAATRGVIAGFIDSVADDEWAKVPGTAELRLDAVKKVLDEYPKLIEQQPDDPDLRYDAALLDRSCANLYRVLGKLPEAKPLYDRSRERLDALVASHPTDGRYLLRRAELLADIGEMQLRTGGPETARATYRAAEQDAAAGREKRPDSVMGLRTLARARIDHADVLGEVGDAKEAAALARRAVSDFGAVIAGDGDEDEESRVVTRLLTALAYAIASRTTAEAGDAETALAMARAADRRSSELSALYGGNPNVDYIRSVALRELGRILSREPETHGEGAAASEQALGMLRGLVAGDGDVANYRPALAEALCDQAEALLDAGDDVGAVRLADEAIAVVEPLNPLGDRDDAFEANRHLARAHTVRGRSGKSRDHLLEADRLYGAVIPAAPHNEKLREEAAFVKRLLAE